MSHSIFSPIEITTIIGGIQKVFDPISTRQIARKTGLVKRWSSRLDGSELFRVLIEKALNPTSAPLNIICEAITDFNPRAEMSIQAVQQRINSDACVRFFETLVFDRVFSTTREAWKSLSKTSGLRGKGPLVQFNKVWVADSTEFPLQNVLSKDFKGSGGATNAEAILKILAIYEVTLGMLGKFVICDRNSPDQKLAQQIPQQIEKDELVLMDRGFFSFALLEQLDEKGAFFITRLHGSVDVYKNKADEKPLSIARYAAQKIAKYGFCDEILYLGSKKKKIRLVALQREKKSIDRELRDYYTRCKKAGRMPSEENTARISLMIWITNIFSVDVSAGFIAKLYGIRWQIELVFKCWKSQLKIDHCRGMNSNRIKVLVLSRMAAILIIALASMVPKMNMELYSDKELSMPKVVNWLQQGDRFEKLLQGDFELVIKFYEACNKWLSKTEYTGRRTCWMALGEFCNGELYVV